MKYVLALAAAILTIVACEVDQEADVTPSPQSPSAAANGADIGQVETEADTESSGRRIGIDVNDDGAGIEYTDDNVDVNVEAGD